MMQTAVWKLYISDDIYKKEEIMSETLTKTLFSDIDVS